MLCICNVANIVLYHQVCNTRHAKVVQSSFETVCNFVKSLSAVFLSGKASTNIN